MIEIEVKSKDPLKTIIKRGLVLERIALLPLNYIRHNAIIKKNRKTFCRTGELDVSQIGSEKNREHHIRLFHQKF